MAIKKICAKAGCSALVDIGMKYCDKHKGQEQIEKTERNRYYDEHIRDQKSREFYHSREWLAVREQALIRDNYLCQHCLRDGLLTPADMVHHKLPIKTHWNIRLNLDNLVSLCNNCHSKIDHKTLGLL